MNWNLIEFVISSKIRFKILVTLLNSNYSPSELATKLCEERSHISFALKELIEKGFVECITPKQRKNKIFQITKKGQQVLKDIHILTKKDG